MASESPLKGILERTERPSKQELERNPPFPSNVVPTPDHYGPHPRQTTEPQREILLSSSANPHPTNYELDREDQPESLANQITQLPTPNSVHSTAPWILASREHHRPKMPMDAEFNTHLADIRRQVDGNSSKSTSRSRSLALLGSRVSIAPSAFSQIFSVASLPPAVEFPATPVFRDEFPAEFTRKLERLAVEQRPKARALKSSHYPLQNSRTDIATGSLDITHEEDNSFSTSSSPNSTPRQQQPMQIPAPTKSVPYYAPNPSRYTPRPQTETPTQTSTQTTLFSDILQQFSGLTFASIASPRITNPLTRSPQPSNYSPFPMIPPEHNKANLKAWWNPSTLVRSANGGLFKDPYRALDTADHPVFGKPLKEILQYANVEISTANANGDLYVWGYIPIVIAKCGGYLKENATEVPGIFSVSGSDRRMRDLQAAFETPPLYGKSLDWTKESYTTHDIASVFRRYLAQMPEPVIPYDLYHPFRDALAKEPFNQEQVITTYKRSLILCMPRVNQCLFLYVLDLLGEFARKSDQNLMTATNLAVIFRPSVISHPNHEMSHKEHTLSQKVLEFLIVHQDWFMLDIFPPELQ